VSVRWLALMLALAAALCGATPTQAQGLFRDTSALEVTIVTELRALIRDRDSTKFQPHPATLRYRDATGSTVSLPITLRTRGHFRRQARNCGFPPIKFEAKRADARSTLFQGNLDLKITTACRPSDAEYQQYVLLEYALYRAYQALSPKFFRTRLARITYRDTTNAMPDVQSWAFFIEDDKEVAQKYGATVLETKGALFGDLDPAQLAVTSLFEYLVANTDWSISGLHNISLMRDSVGTIHPVAYDFDWSGAVNPRYAFPDARLGIRTVTQRLYRGPCLTAAEWGPIFAKFTAARPRIEATYASLSALEPRRRQTALEYLGEFYRIIAQPRSARSALTDGCQAQGN
jgi:hypothetical protein